MSLWTRFLNYYTPIPRDTSRSYFLMPTSGGRGLLPQEADDTSRYVEADGKETTASPLLPPGRVARRGKAARGEGRPCTTKLINRYEHEGGPSVTGSSHATAKSSLSAMCHRRFDAR